MIARLETRLGQLVLDERPLGPAEAGADVQAAMLEGVRQLGLAALPWDRESVSLRERSEWVRRQGLGGEDWPDLSDGHLASTLDGWLGEVSE